MKAALTITPPPWMRDPDLVTLMGVLNSDGLNARLVGGCIRNHLMGHDIKDIDIACVLTPNIVIERLNEKYIKAIPTGIEYGTVTAVINKTHYEITTLRGDHNTDGRHADVIFSDNWNEDAARRDFTINALYADIDGSIYDPLETGIDDIQNKRVRFIGNPEKRIKEDYLRILRFFRFYARYNNDDIHDESFAACKSLKNGMGALSDERIEDEIFKILSDKNADKAFFAMHDAGIFNLEESYIQQLSNLIEAQEQLNAQDSNTRYSQVKIDKKLIKNKRILKFFDLLDQFKTSWDANIKLSLYRFDRDVALQGLLSLKSEGRDISDMTLSDAMNVPVPILPVTATDIMDHLKIGEGREVGTHLKRAENMWIESDFKSKRLDILDQL
ncbi:MAG: hypothetical protein COB76_01475 [Alphaproteobacteria bacterium]|nr:MAG: hypothetical protein COB76_01475 [Alphaproteobacteria bacterium]